jgi:hypothetical protein
LGGDTSRASGPRAAIERRARSESFVLWAFARVEQVMLVRHSYGGNPRFERFDVSSSTAAKPTALHFYSCCAPETTFLLLINDDHW